MAAFFSVFLFLCVIASNGVLSKSVRNGTDGSSLFRFANIYGDHMVLQQAPFRANVWGYGEVGQTVLVNIGNIAYQAPVKKGYKKNVTKIIFYRK